MLLNQEIINICIHMLKNVKYINIYKISLHICNLYFINLIYIIIENNSGWAKKYVVIKIRVLLIITNWIMWVKTTLVLHYNYIINHNSLIIICMIIDFKNMNHKNI